MRKEQWFIIDGEREIITKMFDTYEEAFEFWKTLIGEKIICVTVYG